MPELVDVMASTVFDHHNIAILSSYRICGGDADWMREDGREGIISRCTKKSDRDAPLGPSATP